MVLTFLFRVRVESEWFLASPILPQHPGLRTQTLWKLKCFLGKSSVPRCEGTSGILHYHLLLKSVVGITPVWSPGMSRVWSTLAWLS